MEHFVIMCRKWQYLLISAKGFDQLDLLPEN